MKGNKMEIKNNNVQTEQQATDQEKEDALVNAVMEQILKIK